jgi:hypothetical protein
MNCGGLMGFEENAENTIFQGMNERTLIDKLLAKDDVNELKELIQKPNLTRSELLRVLYMISGTEAKLVNYGEWDRYVILKFFVWIREYVKIIELMFDYEDRLKELEKKTDGIQLTERTKRLLNNNSLLMQHNAKFLIDLYLNIARTSLSLGATGLLELLKNKYEVVYPNQGAPTQVEKQGGGLFGMGKKNQGG